MVQVAERDISADLLRLTAASSAMWAQTSRIKLGGGRIFSFKGHKYQVEIMNCSAQELVIRKPAQWGVTTIVMLDVIHGLINHHYPQGVIYYFPTEKSMEHISKIRFGPLIAENRSSIGKYIRATNSVFVKEIGDGVFLSLLGAKATSLIQGQKKDAMSLHSTSADMVVRDERDSFDDDMADQSVQRLLHSEIKRQVDLGTPSIPGWGIDKLYGESDCSVWQIKCSFCGAWTCLGLEFPDCIRYDKDGLAFRACKKCKREIYPDDGEWVAEHPGRRVKGFWGTQLIGPHTDMNWVMDRFDKATEEGNLGEFNNSILGKPYLESENQLTLSDVYNCCTSETMSAGSQGPCAMGIDVGKTLYIVIGCRIQRDVFEILKVFRTDRWSDIHNIAAKFKVKSCVIDSAPDIYKPREFAAEENFETFLCTYSESLSTGNHWNLQKKVVRVNRTDICDRTHALICSDKRLLQLPRLSEEIKLYSQQLCAMAKVQVQNELTGTTTSRYQKLRGDHYYHATNYFLLAADRIGLMPKSRSHVRRLQERAETDYDILRV